MQLTNPDPLGLRSIMPDSKGSGGGLTDGFKGDFGYGIGLESIYVSNFFLDENDPESEVTTNISPWLSYNSDPEGGAVMVFGANYLPVYKAYLENSHLNGFENNADATLKAEGGKTLISAFTRYSEFSGTDRLGGGFVNGTLVHFGLQASYQIAPRTSIFGNWALATSDYDSGDSVGSDIYTTEIGASWSATERFSFGPVFRNIISESDNIGGSREAWALSVQAQYLVGERIHMRASLGLEYSQNSGEDSQSTVGLTGELEASYAINEKWVWANTIRYATVPSPSETGYVVNNLEIVSTLDRSLLRATLSFGIDYNLSEYESVGTVSEDLSAENNLNVFINYHRNLFSERIEFNTQIGYAVNDGETDWSQIQISAGISVSF
jgi:hypothetical protein